MNGNVLEGDFHVFEPHWKSEIATHLIVAEALIGIKSKPSDRDKARDVAVEPRIVGFIGGSGFAGNIRTIQRQSLPGRSEHDHIPQHGVHHVVHLGGEHPFGGSFSCRDLRITVCASARGRRLVEKSATIGLDLGDEIGINSKATVGEDRVELSHTKGAGRTGA